jgi:uncharacterized protein YgbK (DUF1537 family)
MLLSGQTLAILADDLTGACDSALPFFKKGVPAQVFTNVQALARTDAASATVQEAGVLSVNLQSRHSSPAEAQAAHTSGAQLLASQLDVDVSTKKWIRPCAAILLLRFWACWMP